MHEMYGRAVQAPSDHTKRQNSPREKKEQNGGREWVRRVWNSAGSRDRRRPQQQQQQQQSKETAQPT